MQSSSLSCTVPSCRFIVSILTATTAPTTRLLAVIATRGTLAQWRCHGTGPRYVRFGHRVLYFGADLNAWLDAHVVEAQQPPDRA